MKTLLLVIFGLAFLGNAIAQDSTQTKDKENQQNQVFVDEDGDGYNDNAPDHDGDGIPNGLDPDWQKLKKEQKAKHRFVDLDGDGIDDNLQMGGQNPQQSRGEMNQTGSSLDDTGKQQHQGQQRQNQHGKK